MKWWKRLILAVVSLIWGYVSLDYLYLAFQYLTGARGGPSHSPIQQEVLWEILGLALFLVWILLMAAYIWLIRRLSPQVSWIELDRQSGRQRVRRKWYDVILQCAFVITGMLCRWGYLCFVYLPGKS